ncbi:MAG: hypothetical protein GY810_08125 [Aureispira sp.]|nr:hypothetical protein [Aureispira sp.]
MKNMKNLLLGALVVVVAFASCGEAPQKNTEIDGSKLELTDRGAYTQMDRFAFEDIADKVDLTTMEAVKMNSLDASDDDAAVLANIRQNMLGAEKEAQLLEVEFSMSDEPVEEGVFVFAIESEESKHLTLEMYDEEGFEMAANNEFDINSGNNYKALNVNSLDNGDYMFRLKDAEGKELVRKVSINSKK